jgi:hypothetical protein
MPAPIINIGPNANINAQFAMLQQAQANFNLQIAQ